MPAPEGRRPSEPIAHHHEALRKLIIEEGLTRREAGDRLGLAQDQVQYLCHRFAIKSGRRGGGNPNPRKPRKPRTPSVDVLRLREMLVADKMTRQQVADALGLRLTQVRGLCHTHKIRTGNLGRPSAQPKPTPVERPRPARRYTPTLASSTWLPPVTLLPTLPRRVPGPVPHGPYDLEDTNEL